MQYHLILIFIVTHLQNVQGSEDNNITINFYLPLNFNLSAIDIKDLYVDLPDFINAIDLDKAYLTEFSACASFLVKSLLPQNLMSIGNHFRIRLDFQSQVLFFAFGRFSKLLYIDNVFVPLTWHRICLAHDDDKQVNVVLDGVQVGAGSIQSNRALNMSVTDVNKSGLTLGAYKYKEFLESHLRTNLFHGLLTNVSLWSQSLTLTEMVRITGPQCQSLDQLNPDLFQWSKGMKDYPGTEFVKWSRFGKDICQPREGHQVAKVYTVKGSQDQAELYCQSIGGKLMVPQSQSQLVETFDKIRKDVSQSSLWNHCRGLFWIGVRESQSDNEGYSDFEGNPVGFTPFEEGQPNGRGLQKCVEVQLAKENRSKPFDYLDDWCSAELCSLCEIKASSRWYTLRGNLCGTNVDRHFSITSSTFNDAYFFSGITQDWILFHGWPECSTCSIWSLVRYYSSTDGKNSLGFKLGPPGGHIVGKHSWNISGVIQDLVFTQCKANSSFTCHKNGNCIPREKRCNGLYDCPQGDISDEEDCYKVNINTVAYLKEQPPITLNGNNGDKLGIALKLDVHKVSNVNELMQNFKIKIKVTMTWTDQRLTYNNLRDSSAENALDVKQKGMIWTPSLIFGNAEGDGSTVFDDLAFLSIDKRGQGSPNELEQIHENMVFKGEDNPLMLTRYYVMELHCPFDLTMFPFDKQRCPIVLKVPYSLIPRARILLNLGNVSTLENINLVKYDFFGFDIEDKSEGENITIFLKLRRKFNYHLATTYVPTLSLFVIAELTLFIHESHFEATIMVALTAKLVMYTLYQSVATTLPQTPYIKMIDCWLLVGLIVPFMVIITLIVMDAEKSYGAVFPKGSIEGPWKGGVLKKCIGYTKVAIPVFTLAFVLIYWSIALTMYFRD